MRHPHQETILALQADIERADLVIADERSDFPEILTQLHELYQTMDTTARTIALDGVKQRALTRKEAADILEVHPHTISRWLTAHEVEQKQ